MPQSVVEIILAWSQDRPIWLRDALRRIVTSNELSAHDLDELAEICKVPHGLTESRPVTPLAAEHLPITGPVARTSVSLVSLTHHGFDDPVSSLDHHWRNKIGRRLVAEAKDWQVVVFTHDLFVPADSYVGV